MSGKDSLASSGVSNWNAANAVTVVRILLVPLLAVLLFMAGGHVAGWRWLAALVFLFAASTDRLDGELARRRGTVTEVGKLIDPIADKALTGMALIGLSMLGDLAWWITIVILVREIGITVLRLIVIRHGVIAASMGGKLKTLLQVAAITLYLIPLWTLPSFVSVIAQVLMGLALVVTVVTGVDYLARAYRLARTKP